MTHLQLIELEHLCSCVHQIKCLQEFETIGMFDISDIS